ncbi:probable amidase At4g34880 [Macadamia integrifolia]|uniref:probable amidase At4g34880 n=1 Tax=Macadamia integrifolia TaxID=60698 RepID=UPI001C4E6C93|nr:probable amidase At4g34880 [Macadamia integrifolia]
MISSQYHSIPLSFLLPSTLFILILSTSSAFTIKEATIQDLQLAFKHNSLTSRKVVQFYLHEIHKLNPLLRGVIEVNPDALGEAYKADEERKATLKGGLPELPALHGIPVLLKDNIASKDKLNTTAGSYALLGSVVPRDAGVVRKLRKSGAIILGKASLTEWANFRSIGMPSGWSARGGQGQVSHRVQNFCGSPWLQIFLCACALRACF